MNPRHLKNLEAALYKFGFLDYRQIVEFFIGDLSRRSVHRCVGLLIKDRRANSTRTSLHDHTLYFHWSEGLTGHQTNSLPEHHNRPPRELKHRIACTDVCLALARRAFVTEVYPEHELRQSKVENPVIGRRPDGLFSLTRDGRSPITVAIEVETTKRSRKRVKEVISRYVETYSKDPTGLRGVLIVAATPYIAQVYREVIQQLAQEYPKRFILSQRLDLCDVEETILGRTSCRCRRTLMAL